MTQHLLTINLLPIFLVRNFASYARLGPSFKTLIYSFTYLLFNSPKPLGKGRSIKLNVKMQNKPNFQNTQMNTNPVLIRPYENKSLRLHPQNKPNQTQFKPIFDLSATPQSQNKPNSNPIQTQSKPNPNPISKGAADYLFSRFGFLFRSHSGNCSRVTFSHNPLF